MAANGSRPRPGLNEAPVLPLEAGGAIGSGSEANVFR
jgi:hypothetical protein